MKKYVWKGDAKKGYVYDFEVNGERVVVSSNAENYRDAITAAELPADARLITSTSFPIYDGLKHKDKYTDVIWAYVGALPSGKAAIAYLVEKGVISKEEAQAIYDADEVRL